MWPEMHGQSFQATPWGPLSHSLAHMPRSSGFRPCLLLQGSEAQQEQGFFPHHHPPLPLHKTWPHQRLRWHYLCHVSYKEGCSHGMSHLPSVLHVVSFNLIRHYVEKLWQARREI